MCEQEGLVIRKPEEANLREEVIFVIRAVALAFVVTVEAVCQPFLNKGKGSVR